MEPDKNTSPDADSQASKNDDVQAPVDALSLTPDELEQEQSEQATASSAAASATDPSIKKVSPIKRFFKKVNVYLLIFILLVVVAGAIAVVNYLNSQTAPVEPSIASQELTQDALKDLANTDASVGDASQTLTIQGNAIIAGQTLMRGNLNVAGNIQSGGSIQGPSLTISGASNLGQAQINSLQVATNVAVQGTSTLRDLNVAGTASFSGAVTASQLTVTRIIMSGNAVLQIPNHISFTGASPNRTANTSVLGAGGTASVNGSDTTGTVSINTGNNPTVGCFVRINFQQSFSNAAHVLITPVGAGAGATDYYVDRNNSGFSICSVNIAPANQVFAFDYFVTN
jgi:cytoskeletal protein CcmA (bactofilin family)